MNNSSVVPVEVNRVVEEYDPDCFVLVYAVDDRDSFGELHVDIVEDERVSLLVKEHSRIPELRTGNIKPMR